MRCPCQTPCATPAWGAWSLPTTSHPSQNKDPEVKDKVRRRSKQVEEKEEARRRNKEEERQRRKADEEKHDEEEAR